MWWYEKDLYTSCVDNNDSKHSENMNNDFMVEVKGATTIGKVQVESNIQYDDYTTRGNWNIWINVQYHYDDS